MIPARPALFVLVWLAGAAAAQPVAPPAAGEREAAALRAKGLALGYNLDHAEALEAFKAAIAAAPEHPAAYRLVAATMWIDLLFRQGAVTAEDYLGQARSDVERPQPAPALDAEFRARIGQAVALAEQRVHDRPRDPDAYLQLGAAYGFITTYNATVGGHVFGSIRTARKAYAAHVRALELDPARKDAGLIVGLYRYGVSTLPAPVRLLAGLAGFGGGGARGVAMVEDAARYDSDVRTNALFALIVLYNRDGRFDDALRVIRELQRRYPRNRLLWLEAASTSLRAGRYQDARADVDEGLARLAADVRPRAYGEEARWHYCRGAALVGLRETAAAGTEFRSVLAGESAEWLRGRAHAGLGKIADLEGHRSAAIDEYRDAVRICRTGRDAACAGEAAALLKRAYQ
jgi:tetratricopeptide (TPR) repeat protein